MLFYQQDVKGCEELSASFCSQLLGDTGRKGLSTYCSLQPETEAPAGDGRNLINSSGEITERVSKHLIGLLTAAVVRDLHYIHLRLRRSSLTRVSSQLERKHLTQEEVLRGS